LNYNLEVKSVRTSDHTAVYDYHWSDFDYMQQQISALESTK
jgi:hypothetical protein